MSSTGRLVNQTLDARAKKRIDDYTQAFKSLGDAFDRGVLVQTAFLSLRTFEELQNLGLSFYQL